MSLALGKFHGAVAIIALTLSIAACSESTESSDAAAASARAAAARKAAADPNRRLVSAVTMGKPSAPVALKFELLSKPKVGAPLEIRLQLTPEAAGITGLRLSVQGNDNLQVLSGGELAAGPQGTPGQSIEHKLVVTPTRDGVFYLSAVAVLEGAGSGARTFSIPVLIGDAKVLEAASKVDPAPPVDATGERVSSLPATENATKP